MEKNKRIKITSKNREELIEDLNCNSDYDWFLLNGEPIRSAVRLRLIKDGTVIKKKYWFHIMDGNC